MVTLLRPMWTEQVYPSVRGQDHLGLGSVVTDKILPSLSPGINVLTPHPRYWSFYAFVVAEFWNRDLPKTNAALRRFLRHKESIFSVAGHLCTNPDHRSTPIGSRRVGPLVREGRSQYSANFDYMKSAGGGYGLYYATVMQSMGVIRLADQDLGLPADTITPTVGAAAADAFRSAISGTKYWKSYFDKDEVPASVVEELAMECCLCRLREDSPDREPLVDVFLHGGHASQAASRRLSLQMMLELAAQTSDVALSEDDFRRLMMYQSAYDAESDEDTATFRPPAELGSVARRWRLSQLREMFNWSLNGMWRWTCTWGLNQDGEALPIALGDLRREVDRLALRGLPAVSIRPNQPIGDLIAACREWASMSGSLDGPWELWTDLTEDHLLTLLRGGHLDPAGELAALVVMYVMCLTRVMSPGLPAEVGLEDWRPVVEGGVTRIGMQFALEQLRRDERAGRTISEVAWRVLNDQVIAQHERVALAKLPKDSFRFRREAGRLRFFDRPNEFQRNSSRFGSLSSVCSELGWMGFIGEPGHTLTAEGEQIRQHGDLGVG